MIFDALESNVSELDSTRVKRKETDRTFRSEISEKSELSIKIKPRLAVSHKLRKPKNLFFLFNRQRNI